MHGSFFMRSISAISRICKVCTISMICMISMSGMICMMLLAGCMTESRRSRTSTVTADSEKPRQQNPETTPGAASETSSGPASETSSGPATKTSSDVTPENKSRAASGTTPSKSTKTQGGSTPQQATVDTAKQWKEAREEVEELKRYRPLFLKPTPLDELLAWVPEGKKVQLFDEKCHPVKLERNEGVLTGPVDVKTKISKGVKSVHFKTGHFGLNVAYTGPSSTSYIRNKKGQWIRNSSGGIGSLESRAGALNRVTKNAAYYGGAVVSLKAVCRSYQEKCAICAGGSKRTCRTCRSIQIQAKSRSHGIGFGYVKAPVKRASPCLKEVDCSKPCPEDVLSKKIAQLNSFLKGKEFVTLNSDIENPPILFRTRKACRRHRARHKKSKKKSE